MNEDKKIEVRPFLDWSLVQAGAVKFADYENTHPLPSPKFINYGIEIRPQEAKKTAIWLKAEKPWEEMCLVMCLTVIYENGIYRLWYESVGSDSSGSKLCYAESTDGFNWKKPILNLIEYKGDKKTNIVFDKNSNEGFGYHGGTVFLDPVASPSERYKLIYMCCKKLSSGNGKRYSYQIRGAVSKDGFHWKAVPEPLLDNYFSDTQTVVYYDRKISSYVGYFRSWIEGEMDIFSGGRRAIARAETKDFRKWPVPQTVLHLGVNYHPSHDLYTNAHILYPGRDDLHLFFPAQYDREKDSIEVYLATSRDGVRWEYFGGKPIVPLGIKGSGQEGIIYAGCGLVPLDKDNFALPCSGFSFTHNDVYIATKTKSYSGGYFWATWKKDRLVAIEAVEQGSFSLSVLTYRIAKLYLNFTTKPVGEIRAQISDKKGKPISGYTFSDCSPVRGDELKYPVAWRGKTEIFIDKGKPIVVQFKMNQAKLFALYFEDREKVI